MNFSGISGLSGFSGFSRHKFLVYSLFSRNFLVFLMVWTFLKKRSSRAQGSATAPLRILRAINAECIQDGQSQ
jgi:hypothetical protein